MAGIRAMGTSLILKKIDGESADIVIANLTSIGEQASEIEEIDVTTLDSPGGAKEFIAGATDPGSIEIEGNTKDEEQLHQLYAIYNARNNRDFIVTYPSGSKLNLSGYLSTFKFGEATTDGLVSFGFTIRLSGAPTFEKAPSA